MTTLAQQPVTLVEEPAAAPAPQVVAAPVPRRLAVRRPSRPRTRRLAEAGLVLVLVALVAVVHAHALGGGPAPSDDEGTYVAQAWAINHMGQLAPYTYWYDHPPLGWILIAGWNATFGHLTSSIDAVQSGRELVVVIACITGLLLYGLARRVGLRVWAASAALIMWSLSPLALSYSRMVYLDNIALPMLLGALLLALTPRRHLAAYAGSGMLLAGAVLTKETMLLWAPAVIYAAWRSSAGRTRPFCLGAIGATAILVLALYPLLAVLRGELLPGPNHVSLWDALKFQLVTRPSSGSPLSPGSAAAHQVGAWLGQDPWLLACGVGLAPVAFFTARLRPVVIALLIPVLVSLRPGYLPDPFVIGLLPLCAIVLWGMLDIAVAALALRLTRPQSGLPGTLQLRQSPVVRAGDGRWLTNSRRERWRPALIAGVLAAAVLGVAVGALGSTWKSKDSGIYGDQSQATLVQAEDWMAGHIHRNARVVIDDTMWVDLVQRGFSPHLGVIWFYKTDFTNNLDPSVARSLPLGYRDVQYVVSTPVIRAALSQLPQGLTELRAALKYSKPVASFGSRSELIEVRRLDVPTSAPQLPSPVAP